MTVSAILSGLAHPLGPGYALSRLAARIEPTPPARPVPGRGAAAGRDSEPRPRSLAPADILDLSPAARAAGGGSPLPPTARFVPDAPGAAIDIYA